MISELDTSTEVALAGNTTGGYTSKAGQTVLKKNGIPKQTIPSKKSLILGKVFMVRGSNSLASFRIKAEWGVVFVFPSPLEGARDGPQSGFEG